MDKFIRQLTHDNELFRKQWEWHQIIGLLDKFSHDLPAGEETAFKFKVLDALADYGLAESQPTVDVKIYFLEYVIKKLVDNPSPPLAELVRIFRRVLDATNVFDNWRLVFLRKFYHEFKLGERLSAIPGYRSNRINIRQFNSQPMESFSNGVFISQSTSDTNK